MAERLIAQGNVYNLWDITSYEDQFEEGSTGKVVLGLKSPIPQSWIDGLEVALKEAGATLNGKVRQVTSSPTKLIIPFKKGFPQLVIIIGAIAALALAIWVLVTSWQLLEDVGLAPAKILPFVLLGAVILVGYVILTKRGGILW